jgi:hypothetical protein
LHCEYRIESRGKGLCGGYRRKLYFPVIIFVWVLCVAPKASGSTLLGANPTSLSFGNVPASCRNTLTVTLSNPGTDNVEVSQVVVTGGRFTASGISLPLVLAPGQSSALSVIFAPTTTGSFTGGLSIVSNATNSPTVVSLSGTGVAVQLGVSAASLNFGSVTMGSSSTQTVTLSNYATTSISISQVSVNGAAFSISGLPLPLTLTTGQNATFNAIFAPTASGSLTGSIWIISNAINSPTRVFLWGNGAMPAVNLSSAGLSFASQTVGTTSSPQAVTLTNTGNAPLTTSSLGVSGPNASDFVQTNNCGGSVAAGANCTISVTFTPSARGVRTAALSVADNASGSPQMVSLSGTGTSSAAVVSLSSTSLAFGNQPVQMTSSAQTVTLTNTGNAALSITTLAVTGTNASDFAETNICGSSVAAGANCTIAVMFTPCATGARAAVLSISDNANGSPHTVSLSGTGSHDVILSWTASATPGVMGYDVYRGTNSGGESSTPLNSTPINGTTYTDGNVTAGVTYYYVVTAVASDDVTQSANSNEVAATVPSP